MRIETSETLIINGNDGEEYEIKRNWDQTGKLKAIHAVLKTSMNACEHKIKLIKIIKQIGDLSLWEAKAFYEDATETTWILKAPDKDYNPWD